MSQGADAGTVAFVDAVRTRQLAARHTASLVLGVHAVGVAVLTVLWAGRGPGSLFSLWPAVVPVAVYAVLWVVVRVRAWRTGMGSARDGFGVAAVLSVALTILFPYSTFVYWMAGAGAVLGLGLVVFGVRLRLPALWASGLGLLVFSPLVQLYVVDNHARFLGPQPGTVVLALAALGLAALAAASARSERATLRQPPP